VLCVCVCMCVCVYVCVEEMIDMVSPLFAHPSPDVRYVSAYLSRQVSYVYNNNNNNNHNNNNNNNNNNNKNNNYNNVTDSCLRLVP